MRKALIGTVHQHNITSNGTTGKSLHRNLESVHSLHIIVLTQHRGVRFARQLPATVITPSTRSILEH
jgi:hypothetical protein